MRPGGWFLPSGDRKDVLRVCVPLGSGEEALGRPGHGRWPPLEERAAAATLGRERGTLEGAGLAVVVPVARLHLSASGHPEGGEGGKRPRSLLNSLLPIQ